MAAYIHLLDHYFYPSEFANMLYQWWGIIATIALCLATAFAILPFRIHFYELFLITHIALVILALVACWYHLVPHFGFVYGYQVWLYIAFAFWSADRLARLIRVAYYNRLGSSTAVVKELPDCNIVQVTIFPRVTWDFGPGQYTFIYLPKLGKFWESHPLTIAGWKGQRQSSSISATSTSPCNSTAEREEKNAVAVLNSQRSSTATKQQATSVHQTHIQGRASIHFLIRAHSGMTSTLQRQLLSSPSHSNMEIPVYTEGPYAGHRATLQSLFVADTVLCLVGGIGITSAFGFVQEYASKILESGEGLGKTRRTMKAKRFILAWSAREMALIEHVKQNFLLQIDRVEGFECSFWCTGTSNATEHRVDSINDESDKVESLTSKTALTKG
jgi:hypothetical protein